MWAPPLGLWRCKGKQASGGTLLVCSDGHGCPEGAGGGGGVGGNVSGSCGGGRYGLVGCKEQVLVLFFFVLFSRGTGVHCGNGLTCCSVVCVSYGLVRGGRMAVALHVFMPVLEEG